MYLCVHVRRTRGEEKGRGGRGEEEGVGEEGECLWWRKCMQEGLRGRANKYSWWKYVQEGYKKKGKESTNFSDRESACKED